MKKNRWTHLQKFCKLYWFSFVTLLNKVQLFICLHQSRPSLTDAHIYSGKVETRGGCGQTGWGSTRLLWVKSDLGFYIYKNIWFFIVLLLLLFCCFFSSRLAGNKILLAWVSVMILATLTQSNSVKEAHWQAQSLLVSEHAFVSKVSQ